MNRLTVLVIDDASSIRRLVALYLGASRLADFACLEASGGREGLELLEQHRVDLILLDWNMPGMSGDEFVVEVRKRRETRDIPIVMVTVESSLGKVTEAMELLGVNGFVSKPFTLADLNSKLEPIVQALGGGAPLPGPSAAPASPSSAPGRHVDVKRVAALAVLGIALVLAMIGGYDVVSDDADNAPAFWRGSVCTGTLVTLSPTQVVVDVNGSTRRFQVDSTTRFTSRGAPGNPTPGSTVQVRFSGGGKPHARLIRLLAGGPSRSVEHP